jgi:hypothetical protein
LSSCTTGGFSRRAQLHDDDDDDDDDDDNDDDDDGDFKQYVISLRAGRA